MDDDFYGLGASGNNNNLNSMELIRGESPILDFRRFNNATPSSSPSASSEDTDSENDPGSTENQEIILPPPDPDLVMHDEAQPLMNYRVLDALVHGKNLLIECPPGRERTLTILKQVLNYFQWKKGGMRMEGVENYEGVPATTPKRIYVVTRNFKESKAFLEEMKTKLLVGTQLLWNIQMSVLDHRKNYCVNEETMGDGTDSAGVDHACRKMIRRFNQNTPSSSKRGREEDEISCEYFRNSRNFPDGAIPFIYPNEHALFGLAVNNIEDFVEESRGAIRCPYYDSLHLAKKADLVFLPADIFLSPYFRQEYSIDLEDAIVFMDDGFDLENLCKEQASVDISLHQLNQVCATIRNINDDYQQRVRDDIGLIELVNFLPLLSQFVARNEHEARPGPEEVLDVIRRLNVDALNIPALTQEILDFGENAPANIDIEVEIIDKLRKLVTVLGLLLRNNADENERFRVQVKARESRANRDHEMFLQITCADPCLIMAPIESSVISLLIAGNCIAPYSPFYNEFNGIFTEDGTLKIEHDDMSRYLIEYATKGPSGAKFALGFDGRDEPIVKKEVLMAILELCKVIPQNVICFFHSGSYLRNLLKYMQNEKFVSNGILIEEEIGNEKRIFCEIDARNDTEAQELMQKFHTAGQDEPGGAVLFALHRGKLCKNYELEHESVRGIVHISIPFGPWYHHQDIAAKRKYYGESNHSENLDWYHCEAFRILNQSFNYCVKGREDWGVVVVLDSRMHGERHRFEDRVPHWARQGNFPKRRREFSALINSVRTKVREWTAGVGNQ